MPLPYHLAICRNSVKIPAMNSEYRDDLVLNENRICFIKTTF